MGNKTSTLSCFTRSEEEVLPTSLAPVSSLVNHVSSVGLKELYSPNDAKAESVLYFAVTL